MRKDSSKIKLEGIKELLESKDFQSYKKSIVLKAKQEVFDDFSTLFEGIEDWIIADKYKNDITKGSELWKRYDKLKEKHLHPIIDKETLKINDKKVKSV